MTRESASAAQAARQKRRFVFVAAVVVIIFALAFLAYWATSMENKRVRDILNDAAYSNTQNTLQSLSDMVSNTFELDQQYLETLASSMAVAQDRQQWLDSLDYDMQRIQGLFYADAGANSALGKDGSTLDLASHTFAAHAGGQVRSEPFMTDYGTYSYLMRVPVLSDGVSVGYLYAQYPMSRMREVLPQNVSSGNDISLIEASTLTYVYIPSTNVSGVHVNYNNLQYYLEDPSRAPEVVSQIENAIAQKQYYMQILTFKHEQNSVAQSDDYVVYLWPVDDGEYYISGFTKVEYLQSERVTVENTVNAMFGVLLGVSAAVVALLCALFASKALSSRRKAQIQQQHNEELHDALEIARSANESKSNFLSNMSHDIRTPMNAIVGYTTLLGKDAGDADKVTEYAGKIAGAGDYLLGLINDVLDMSKIESGKTTLTVSQFHISRIVDEAESIMRMQADDKRQNFEVNVVDVAHDSVMGDKVRIRQIILNLLSNSLKYTPEGGKIAFTVQGVSQPKASLQKIRIIVQDTGYGMDPEFMKTIFEPFTRINNSMTGKIQGTGLGLAITKNIVELMGGTITVHSVVDKGSTFTVELELPVAPDEPAVPSAAADQEEIEFALSGLRILAAEDNELNAEILCELLAMEGATCKVCEDGEKVVAEFEHADAGTYDLVLMDVQMPVMNGYEATKAIRASGHPEAKTIPIVAMTANAFAEDVLNALQSGMDAHVAKPVDMPKLKETIFNVLNGKKER